MVSPAVFTVGLFVVWELVCRRFKVPLAILPAPSDVFAALWQYRKPIWDNSFVTLWTTLAGFLLATGFGLALGIAVGWHRALYDGIYPVLIGFNSVPKVAVVPVLILWFGIGEIPAVLTAFLISFFPIVVNVATGLATTEPELEDVLRALGASKLDIMRKVGIPRSLPYFFGSLKVAITLAFVGAVVSETVGANKGIGKLMLDAQARLPGADRVRRADGAGGAGHPALRRHRARSSGGSPVGLSAASPTGKITHGTSPL